MSKSIDNSRGQDVYTASVCRSRTPSLFNEILVVRLRQMRPSSSCICHLQQGPQTSEEYDLIPSHYELKAPKGLISPEYGWPRGERRGEREKISVKENA